MPVGFHRIGLEVIVLIAVFFPLSLSFDIVLLILLVAMDIHG